MKKYLIILLLFMTTAQSFAMVEKVYNEFGQRVGSVRKKGDAYEWFDMDNRQVKSYKDLSGGAEIFVGTPGRRFNYYSYDPYHYYVNYPYYFYNNIPQGGVKVIKTGHSYYN